VKTNFLTELVVRFLRFRTDVTLLLCFMFLYIVSLIHVGGSVALGELFLLEHRIMKHPFRD